MIDISHTEEIYTVSRLNREARFLLECSFPSLWVEGEISGFKAHSSGHWYFSLKDQNAQVRCAMFRPQNRYLNFLPKDGMQVITKVRVSLYEGRGDYQLIAEWMEEAGEGKLRQEFEALKKRLAEAGLFDVAHKKSLPAFPQSIGIITSPTGAAIKDILSVLKRRYACVPVIIYPTLVQGDTAAVNIIQAIEQANHRKECDVLILARGGGSLEDLWCFNDERVAKAIFHSHLPIVSGVGHEIDFTIADFVADLRAATPSAAAELVVPEQIKLIEMLTYNEKQLIRLIQQKITQLQQHITWIQKHLQQQHPKRRLLEQSQQLDFYEIHFVRLQNKLLADLKNKLNILNARLLNQTPNYFIQQAYNQLTLKNQLLQTATQKSLNNNRQLLANLSATLDALSPLATLQRGFSITTRVKDNHILKDATQVNIGEKVRIQLTKGNLECTVDGKSEKYFNSNAQ